MGLFDNLTTGLEGMLGSAAGQQIVAALPSVLAAANQGGLQGVVNQLQQNGLGAQVSSWLGSGQNLPVTPQQIQEALGSDAVKQIAQHFGVNVDMASQILAHHLPAAVDRASPNGTLAAN